MECRETTRLLPPHGDWILQRTSYARGILCVVATLLGAFLASTDESLMISMYSIVGSDLRRLHEASWLLISYNLGYSIALPICGKLAQIYGRKHPLLISYALFTVGNLWVGLAGSLWVAVAGRLVTGLGGAGLIGLVSVIITDIARPHQIALFRSYVTVITTIGRSAGPPLGAMLSDIVGWRWSFLAQCPLSLCCAVFIAFTLPTNLTGAETPEQERKEGLEAVRQIDFSGIFAFIVAVSTFILFIDLGGDRLPWTHPFAISLAVICAFSAIAFVIIERFWAANPLTPLSMLSLKAGGGFCIIQVLVFLGRFAIVTNLVPYFIYTQGISNTMAALCMVPSSFGAAVGGLASGFTFTRFPRYKLPTLILTTISIAAYFAIALRWTHNNNGISDVQRHPAELSYIFVVGVAFGWTLSAQFIGMSRFTPRRFSAEGITAYYLAQQVGSILGTNVAAKLLRNILRGKLKGALPSEYLGDPGWDKDEIVEEIIKDSRFYQKLPTSVGVIVRKEYLSSFRYVPLFSIGANVAVIGVQLLLPETHDNE
ncbi:Major facilitator superfamily [Neofusicoccum parvum]|uniref:Major facilitator superfamily n=1 Tax=Neofusicoccum parvum TaxID=310453 RepID=A0ACB5SD60_9PEZI|nr:Major facilitator superfamily [Neofusicoccum parvum]